MIYIALSPLYLLVFYILFIQHERGGWWVVFKLFGIPGYVLDVLLNYTLFALLFWCWPGRKFTFSMQLPVLLMMGGKRSVVAGALISFLNHLAPSGKHIPV